MGIKKSIFHPRISNSTAFVSLVEQVWKVKSRPWHPGSCSHHLLGKNVEDRFCWLHVGAHFTGDKVSWKKGRKVERKKKERNWCVLVQKIFVPISFSSPILWIFRWPLPNMAQRGLRMKHTSLTPYLSEPWGSEGCSLLVPAVLGPQGHSQEKPYHMWVVVFSDRLPGGDNYFFLVFFCISWIFWQLSITNV